MDRVTADRHEAIEIRLGPAPDPVPSTARVDVVFTEPGGRDRRVPAFASGGEWRVRYSSSVVGGHGYLVDADDDFDHRAGVIEVEPGDTSHTLAEHGPLRVAGDHRHLVHADGTPFLWLADTWWEGLTRRVTMEQFRDLAAQRIGQGFSVVQLVAGLYPEMAPFAAEGESVSGWAWHRGFTRPNQAWFDEADERVAALVGAGLVPCIVGAWGFYMPRMGTEKMLRHWRELVARWGAYPVVWCLAGELTALEPETTRAAASRLERGNIRPGSLLGVLARQISLTARRRARSRGFPDSESIATLLGLGAPVAAQVAQWNEVLHDLRRLDPFSRVLTVHPQPYWPPYELVEDHDSIDMWMLQSGHSGIYSLAPSVGQVEEALSRRPPKPVLVGEVDYEGILGSSGHEMQRFLFWSHLLSGAAGHTYGAQGLWGFNTADYPGGEGGRWSDLTWQQAAALPGATHVGIGRQILLGLPWHRFEPHPEWVRPHQRRRDRIQPYAAGLADGPRVIYFPAAGLVRDSLGFRNVQLAHLGNTPWQAQFVNPRTAAREPATILDPASDGTVTLDRQPGGPLPSKEDWVLLLEPGHRTSDS